MTNVLYEMLNSVRSVEWGLANHIMCSLHAVSALKRSFLVCAGFNTAGFAITAITQSHKITDLTVRVRFYFM